MIRIICVGKLKEDYLNNLVQDYLKRISKYHKITIHEIKDSNSKEETKKIIQSLDKKDYNILLHINGEMISSNELASKLKKLFIFNSRINFVIGGSDGVESDVLEYINEEISFSKLTFPHGLFRGILLEQIYRAFKINNNEKYHK